MIIQSYRNIFLKSFYKALNSRLIRYVCIGEPFYIDASTGDIDILVMQDDYSKMNNILLEIIGKDKNNKFLKLISSAPIKQNIKYLIKNYEKDESLIQIDITCSPHWRGLYFYKYDDINNSMILKSNEAYFLEKNVSLSVGALKDLLYTGSIKEKRFKENLNKLKILSNLRFVNLKFKKILLEDNYKLFNFFKLRLILFLILNRYKSLTRDILKYLIFILKRFLFSKSCSIIAFYGPDGAGKSTIINQLKEDEIIKNYFKTITIFHTRPGFLPPFSKLKFKKINYKNNNKNLPRSIEKISFIKAIIFLIYYAFDYLLGNIFMFFKNFSKDNHLIIYDRYIYDFFYQQIYYFLPDKLLSILKIINFPGIKSYFLFGNSMEIYSRKKELSSNDIEYQINTFKKIDKKYKLNVSFLNSTEMSKKEILQNLIKDLQL